MPQVISDEQMRGVTITYLNDFLRDCVAEKERMKALADTAPDIGLHFGALFRSVDIKRNMGEVREIITEVMAYDYEPTDSSDMPKQERLACTLTILQSMADGIEEEDEEFSSTMSDVIKMIEADDPGWKDGVTMILGAGGSISDPQGQARDHEG